MNTIPIEYPINWTDYELIDSGGGEKLERFNGYKVIRPDPRAIWLSNVPSQWETADAKYVRTDSEYGKWNIKNPPPPDWRVTYKNMSFILKPTDFKHIGIFPEQAVNWDWLTGLIDHHPIKILNLFGYTGASTVVSAKNGAIVTHVDSSKPAITWAHENAKVNAIPNDKIRWIEDDVTSFVKREQRRGNTYDGVILDPPRFGRGVKGQVWKLADDLPQLLGVINAILSPKSLFVLLNAYTADLSSIAIGNLMQSVLGKRGGNITSAEVATKESSTNRLLPQGIYSRWKK